MQNVLHHARCISRKLQWSCFSHDGLVFMLGIYPHFVHNMVKNIIQIMNVCECNGKNIFNEMKDEIFHWKMEN